MKKKTTPSLSKKNLNKKLKSYAAIAASVAAADATAQVGYTDIPDTTITNSAGFFDIDLNNDGTNDFTFSVFVTSGSNTSVGLYYSVKNLRLNDSGTSSNSINVQMNAYSYYEVAALNANTNINPTLNSWSTYGYVAFQSAYSYGTQTGGFTSGQFAGAGTKFIGVRFVAGANTHYGWIRIDVPASADRITIFDYAFDSTANTPILAGDTGLAVGIDEFNEKNIELYANGAELNFPNSLDKGAEYRVYSLNGQLQERGRIAAGKNQHLLRKNYNGIYIVELNNEEGTFRKKLWLESK